MMQDVKMLQGISKEMHQLIADGEWDRQAFERLYELASKAAGGEGDFLEFLILEADPAWVADEDRRIA